jgi:Na+-transporting methylmalonyl-CoA/oxaloacetate decarboxylase gamma subunit
MISDELKSLLIQVITSWQVIGAAVVLVLYFSLVTYVARFRRRLGVDKPKPKPKPKKEKKEKTATSEEEEEAAVAQA